MLIEISPYPKSMKDKVNLPEKSPIYRLDDSGVILYKIPYTERFDYYPVNIAQYALGNLEMFLETGEQKYKKNFLINVEWLFHHMTERGGAGVWEHRFILPYGYNFKIPWVHGMAQGLIISSFIRAYKLTGDVRFKNAAEKALLVYTISIPDGGVRFIDNEGNVWFEEYGVIPPTHILNGFIYSLFGIYEAKKYLNSTLADKLWREGLKTLKKNIHRYDIGYWSLYDLLHKYPAPINYHSLHIQQLRLMYEFSGENIFKMYAERWNDYRKKRVNLIKSKIYRGVTHIKKHGIFRIASIWITQYKYFKR